MSKKKKHQGYLPITMLNAEIALAQAAFALDGAYLAAHAAGDSEQMATVGALWMELKNHLGPLKSQIETEVREVTSKPFKLGFSGTEEEEDYDGTDE